MVTVTTATLLRLSNTSIFKRSFRRSHLIGAHKRCAGKGQEVSSTGLASSGCRPFRSNKRAFGSLVSILLISARFNSKRSRLVVVIRHSENLLAKSHINSIFLVARSGVTFSRNLCRRACLVGPPASSGTVSKHRQNIRE